MFTKNLETKIMALMIAVALWIFALNEHSSEWAGSVPVRVEKPDDVAILNEYTERLYCTFGGPERLIREFRQNYQGGSVAAVCRVVVGPDAAFTEQTSRIRFEDAKDFEGVPDGLRLVNAPTPPEVLITAMKLSEKRLFVKLQIAGDLPPGYEIVQNSEAVYPSEVSVKGPKKALDAAEYISTEPFKISEWPTLGEDRVNINNSIDLEQFLRIQTPEGEKKLEVTCKASVRFWIDLVRKRAEITVSKIPVKVLQPPDFAYLAKPVDERVEIQFRGPKTILDKLNNTNVLAFVDVGGLQPSKVPHSLPIQFDLPPEAQGKVEVVGNLPKIGVDIFAQEERTKPEGKTAPGK